MSDIHSCGYYCDRPACIKAQRDELRDKLAQPEQESFSPEAIRATQAAWKMGYDAAKAEQPEQKPVPWESFFKRYCPWMAQPEQDVPATCFGNIEPVGWLESPDGAFRENPLYKIKFPSKLLSWQVSLYTAAPQRKPLTDKAITQVIDSMPKKMKGFMVDWDLYEFARAIEAAHGIKENT
jgi:hypothetical protein